MKKGLVFLASPGLLATCPDLHARASSLPPLSEADKGAKYDGISALTHFRTRVYGYFFNAATFSYFRGTHADLREFLGLLAGLDEAKDKCIDIRPGPGRYTVIAGKGRGGPADWMISMTPGKNGPSLTLTIWSSPRIDPAKLKLPEGIKVSIIAKG